MPTPNIDKLIDDWRDHHEECLFVMVRRVPQGYLAELRLGAPGHSSPVFHPEDGTTTLCGAGANPSEALAKLDERCGPLPPPERWAFWTYDSFPFTLGARMLGDSVAHPGYVKVVGYGGHVFKPFAIIEAAGKQLAADLQTMGAEYAAAQRELDKTFKARLRARLARDGAAHPKEVQWSAEAASEGKAP